MILLEILSIEIFPEWRPADQFPHVGPQHGVGGLYQHPGLLAGLGLQAAQPGVQEYGGDGLQGPPEDQLQHVLHLPILPPGGVKEGDEFL